MPIVKVEMILKGSLVLIPSPSPSVEIQIMGGKVCLRCKDCTAGHCQQTFENKKFVKLLKTKSLLTSPMSIMSDGLTPSNGGNWELT